MKVINFSHPLSEVAVNQLNERFGNIDVTTIKVAVDMAQPLNGQVEELLNPVKADIDGTKPFVVVMPGLSNVAAMLTSAIQGLSGSMPTIVELRMNAEKVFEVFDVIDLQAFRNHMRNLR